jgi:hypothetical protein
MEFKEQVVEGLKDELEAALPDQFWTDKYTQVKCDHGCWEVRIRCRLSDRKLFECTLAYDRGDDSVDDIWVYFNEDYDKANCHKEVLSDPDWIGRVIALVKQRLA